MKRWHNGDIMSLLEEGRPIQKRYTTNKRRSQEDITRIFSKLMLQGKVGAAIKLLEESNECGVHEANDEIITKLRQLHPSPSEEFHEDSLMEGPLKETHDSYFDNIDEDLIKIATMRTKGAEGPSKMDADQYKVMLVSNKFKKEGKELRMQIAKLAKLIATKLQDPHTIEAFIACRLIPLNKNPGVRPIGIGEILRIIISKAIV